MSEANSSIVQKDLNLGKCLKKENMTIVILESFKFKIYLNIEVVTNIKVVVLIMYYNMEEV
jgi:hypothetical protein